GAAPGRGGLVGRASRTVVVRPPNVTPTVTIDVPADSSGVLAGRPVLLAATAVDAEDGDLGAGLRWTSSVDGPLGTGSVVVAAGLSPGTHVLTASVTDRDNAPGSASVTVTASPTTLVFPAVADTYVDAAAPTTAFGPSPGLLVSSSPLRQAFLRFAVSGLGAFPVNPKPLLVVDLTQNTAPIVRVTAPASRTKIAPGAALTFAGTALDAQDGNLSARIRWVSSRDGMLGTGSSVTATLSEGIHTVTATV